ncbi:Rha family transcriptional regulator [Bacillus pseudomycoides]|uniref:Rha family transcriptional regulator n=1 Tax=Bacillus pseudomycoides TaxID=64104 RepID=UPI000BF2C0E4|nr:Rha family transcriptional regulator [Bacillus pseudomycoides]MED4653067.1 Rha family transcriptional regulator [Bacillus pseudomycoides]PGC23529.1 Rha family transcriptional regulator [Bacillus pseudomycoides]
MAVTKKREDIINNLVFIEGHTIVTDSLTVAYIWKEDHNSVISTIVNQIQKLNEAGESDFSQANFIKSSYTIKGIDYPKFTLTEIAFACITMGDIDAEALKMKIKFLKEFKHVKERNQHQKKTPVETLLRIQQLEKKVINVEHRINSLDTLNIESCLQQRLNKMIQRLAFSEGISFQKAWRVFRSVYNRAYRTNLKLKMNNYKKKNELKQITAPQYLAITNQLESAIRVADKLLNKKNAIA